MPSIKEIFNKISEKIFRRNPVLQIDAPKQPQIEIPKQDLMLKGSLRKDSLDFFEEPLNYNDYCKNFFSISDNFKNQYDYVELITKMQESGAMKEYQGYLDYVKNNPGLYYPSQVHGVDHTSRVVLFAEMLCMLDSSIISEHDKNLIMVAAQLHDIGREDDGKNFDHGLASSYKIDQLGLLRNFDIRDQDIIKFAVEAHSLEPDQIKEKLKTVPRKDRKDYEKVLNYLQDADKLDRTRIANHGWGLEPNRLASDTAKRLVKVAHQNYYEYHNMMRYEEKIEEQDLYGNKLTSYLGILREKGYNITLDALSNIVSEYKPGTLEMLYSQDRLTDLFSYDTFKKYRKEESFEDILKPDRINPDELFTDVTRRQQVELMRETFDLDFMLYYNLKKNNKEAFDLLCYTDVDIRESAIAGVVEKIRLTDLDKLNQKGHFFRMNDLVYLASKVTPEEYAEIANSGKIEDLYSSKYCKNPAEIESVRNALASKGISIDEDTFNSNFRLLEYLSFGISDVLQKPGIEKYSLPEIFGAATKLADAKFRIRDGKSSDFSYDSQTILNLLEYNRNVVISQDMSEEDMLDMVEQFAKSPSYVKDPRYIEYSIKRNRPYQTKDLNEILNYREFCADKILADPNMDLQNAKKILLNALFSIDVPHEQRDRFEKEMMDTLYFHQKYLSNSDLETTHKSAMDAIRSVFESDNITDFRNLLYQNKALINSYNTDQVGYRMQWDMAEFSRENMVEGLQSTYRQIENMPNHTVIATNGRPVTAKVLMGEEFYLATSTAMPKCSSRSNKILVDNMQNYDKARSEIYNTMLGTQIMPQEICTSITSNKMIAHAGSALSDQELVFAYIPNVAEDISIVGMHDMSTTKNKEGKRVTQVPTTPRSIEDYVAGTTEEHNEAVMSNVYPRYIVCYDQITDIAIAKRDALEEEYKAKGISQPIEILFIDGKGTYIPQIKNNVEQEHASMRQKLENGQFTYQDFENMFEKKESNFALRTLQAIHSTSYRRDNWDDTYNRDILDSMIDIIEKVSEIIPPEKARSVEKVVSTLIDRSDRKSLYGSRFYDQTYADSINSFKLEEIRDSLMSKIVPYERNQAPMPNSNARKVDDAEQVYE